MHRMKRILSLVILAAMAVTAVVGLTSCGGTGPDYDYSKKDMAKYLSIDRADYYGAPITVTAVDEVTDEDVEELIDSLRLQYATSEAFTDGAIAKNDTVVIFYRGQVEVDGKWVDFVGGSNLHSTAYSLTIGSKSFIDGFEDALIGKNLEDAELTLWTNREKIVGQDGEPIVYVSYNYEYTDKDNKKKTGTFRDRIDLHCDEEGSFTVPGRYDEGTLRADLLGKKIGTVLGGTYTASFDITGDLEPETVTMTNVKITHIVGEETTFGENGYLTVSFPEEYPNNEKLAGKTARWYVSVVSASRPTMPEITASFVTDKLGIAYEELLPVINELQLPTDTADEREAATVAALPGYMRDYLEENRENNLYQAAIAALIEHMMEKAVVTDYPKGLLEDTIEDLWEQNKLDYESYMSSSSSSGAYYANVNEYIVAYYGEEYFPDGTADMDAGMKKVAEDTIKRSMLIHYIADKEGLSMSRRERKQAYEERLQMMLDYYNAYYGTTGTANEFTAEDLENAGYTEDVILEDILYEKVYEYLYEALKTSDSITYEPAEE